jgi:ectoine hydroxylase-related dioxygenase (phytanoyl-CoA dioxygenase family)
MKFVPASQNLGIMPHLAVGIYDGVDGTGKKLEALDAQPDAVGAYMTTVDPARMVPLEPTAIDVPLNPGDIVLFSNILVHQGGKNTTDKIRWHGARF